MKKKRATADRRSVRTTGNVKNAFMELIGKKAFDSITVTELAERAGVNRKTFYFHYNCIEDVLEEVQVETVEGIEEALGHSGKSGDLTTATAILKEIADSPLGDKLERLMLSKSYDFYFEKITELISDTLSPKLVKNSGLTREEIGEVTEYCVYGIVHTARLRDKKGRIDRDEFVDICAHFIVGACKSAKSLGRHKASKHEI